MVCKRVIRTIVARKAIWIAFAFGIIMLGDKSWGADGTWQINGSSVWSLPANWSGGVPSQPGDIATFGSVITGDKTVTVDAPFTVGGLLFDDNNAYRIGGAKALTLSVAAGDASISVNNSNGNGAHSISAPLILSSTVDLTNNSTAAFTISGAISGTAGLDTFGPGLTVLSGNNSNWSGGMILNS